MAQMLSITTVSYSNPSNYQLSSLPQPVVSEPTDVIIQVYAASINPIDVKLAAGVLKFAVRDEFPFKIGYDCSGVVTAIGNQVTRMKIGDEVYARLPESNRGSWSEYAKCAEYFIALKPKSLSFGEAASLPLAAMTALQAFKKYKGSLAGKTVFIPAGLSGTGAYACQLAKNVFNAGKVITTVSTTKVDLVPKLLMPGVVDQVIDYTKNDPREIIPARSVDFILDTTGQAMQFLSLMTPSTSLIVSISTQPSGTQLQDSSVMRRTEAVQVTWLARVFLNGMDEIRKARARRWQVEYTYMFLEPNGRDLELLDDYVTQQKVIPVIGSKVSLRDIEKVREASQRVFDGKGGIGKAIIEVNQT